MTYERLVSFFKNGPRLTLRSTAELPKSSKKRFNLHSSKKRLGHRSCGEFQNFPPLGTIAKLRPFYLTAPNEPYNRNINSRRHYTRVSLLQLQRMIDMNRLNCNEPIDLTSIMNTKLIKLDPINDRNYGIHLTDEGIDQFNSPVNIEVQYASEEVIAAVERAGGVITTRYYDLFSIFAKADPENFFKQGIPIPREYYTNERNRGYLADPEKVAYARIWLSQKYGYEAVDLSKSDKLEVLRKTKLINQIFFGLQSGWIVNMADQVVLKPLKNEE